MWYFCNGYTVRSNDSAVKDQLFILAMIFFKFLLRIEMSYTKNTILTVMALMGAKFAQMDMMRCLIILCYQNMAIS